MDALGGRRFLLTVAAQISCNVLVWFGKISGEVYSVVVLATVAAYIAGNVSQRKIEAPSTQSTG